jgi:hypothetical protein
MKASRTKSMSKLAYVNLIEFSLEKKYSVSVWDGSGYQVKRSTIKKDIVDAIKNVKESTIKIRNGSELMGSAKIILEHLQEPENTVAEYSESPEMQEWNDQYKAYAENNFED